MTLNTSLLSFEWISTILQLGKVAEISIVIENTGIEDVENRMIQLFVNEKRVAQTMVDIKSGAKREQQFNFVLDQSGWCTGKFIIDEDQVLDDNMLFFSFYVPPTINLLVVGNSKKELFFTLSALALLPGETSNLNVTEITFAQLAYQPLHNYNVLILNDMPALPDENVYQLIACQ